MHADMLAEDAGDKARNTDRLIAEVRDPSNRQKTVAIEYARAVMSGAAVDWRAVNDAIMKRWSNAGLKRVKSFAWARIEYRGKE